MGILDLIKRHPFMEGMISKEQMPILLNNLAKTIENDIAGDVVELGCNYGTASIMFGHLLNECNSNKKLYLYDSFAGLPEKKQQDINETGVGNEFVAGWMSVPKEIIESNFRKEGLTMPIITKGWFKDIPDELYPNPISFAFFDGDFYDSIIDSFNKVYHKMSKGGIICVHDYQWPSLPGVEKACKDFIKDDSKIVYAEPYIAIITKE